jgi:hypothetical protein
MINGFFLLLYNIGEQRCSLKTLTGFVHGFRGTLQRQSFLQQTALNDKSGNCRQQSPLFISTIYIL